MTPAEASAILDREYETFAAQYQDPPPPDGGTWTPFALAVARHAAWEKHAVAALAATGEPIEDDTPAPRRKPRDTSDWYDRNIAATQRRITRNERRIAAWENRPQVDTSDALAAINLPLKQRQRGMAGDLKAWRAYDSAIRDQPAAHARLAKLEAHHPHAQKGATP